MSSWRSLVPSPPLAGAGREGVWWEGAGAAEKGPEQALAPDTPPCEAGVHPRRPAETETRAMDPGRGVHVEPVGAPKPLPVTAKPAPHCLKK